MYKKLSIVVPCYNEEEAVPLFYNEVKKQLKTFKNRYEIIFIDDGSKDNTSEVCQKLCESDRNVKLIKFSRNFGKEAGILAGLENSTGDFIAVMDVDLQDPPEYLKIMYETLLKGEYDIVGTRRVNRDGEPPIRSFFARQFYKLINKFTEVEIVDGARDYRMMTKEVVNAVLQLKEYHRFSKGLFVWVGFKTKYLEYKNVERVAGETSWSFWGLFKYAIEGIVAFTVAPLRIATIIGVIVSLASVLFMLFIVARTFLFGDPVAGWTSTIAIILFLGGIQLVGLGIIGEYLSKTYMEVKHRPNYITKD